jgi:hypothetical protein
MGASGNYILGMLGPLLGLTQSQIVRLLKYHTYMDEYSSAKHFKFIKRVYELSNKARSDVVLCVAKFLTATNDVNVAFFGRFFMIIWEIEKEGSEDISLIVMVMKNHIRKLHAIDDLKIKVSNQRHSESIIRLLEAVEYNQKHYLFNIIYGSFKLSPVNFKNRNSPLIFIESLLDYAFVSKDEFKGPLCVLADYCLSRLSEAQREQLARNIIAKLEKESVSRSLFQFITRISHICFSQTDFLSVIKTKFFTERLTDRVHCEDCITFINACLVNINPQDGKEIRKYIQTYCGSNPMLFYPYFKKLKDPVEARYFEDNVVEYLEKANEKDFMKSVHRFTLKHGSKFFTRFENLLLADFDLIIRHEHDSNIACLSSPGKLFRKNVIANHSARGRFVATVLNIPKEVGILLRFTLLQLKFTTDLEYHSFTTILEELLLLEKDTRIGRSENPDKKIVQELLIKAQPYFPDAYDFTEFLATLMIRYQINHTELFRKLEPYLFREICELYNKLVVRRPQRKSINFSSSFLDDSIHSLASIYTLSYLREYLTDSTYDKFEETVFRNFPRSDCLPVYIKNVRKYETDIVSTLFQMGWYDEIQVYVGISRDISRVSKIQLYSHWFFVDEIPENVLLWSEAFFLNTCMDLAAFNSQVG